MQAWRRWLVLAVLTALVAGVVLYARSIFHQSERDAALALAHSGRFVEAEPGLLAALARHPEDVAVLEMLCRGYRVLDRRSDEEACLNQWVAAAPASKEARKARLAFFQQNENYAAAAADAASLLERDPDDLELRRLHAGLRMSLGEFADAEQECRRYLEERPNDLGQQVLLAEIQRAQGKHEAAAKILDTVLEINPGFSRALFSSGVLAFESGKADVAVPLFRRVLELDPQRQRTARYHLSLALARLGQTQEAEQLMSEVRRMQEAELLWIESKAHPTDQPLQLRAAQALLDNKDYGQAQAVLETILTREPTHHAANLLLAEVFEKRGQPARGNLYRNRTKKQTP